MFDDLLPISALQHLLFCERQAMLIHLERQWAESRLTVEGQQLHRRAHREQSAWRGDVFIARSVQLASDALGMFGRADIVEFRPPKDSIGDEAPSFQPQDRAARTARASPIASFTGAWTDSDALRAWNIVPIEYKRGRPKANDCDRVQLCAQAICLEEMLRVAIEEGEIFYGKRRRRVQVPFDAGLRETTRAAAERLRRLFADRITPPAQREPKCDACSLLPLCLPGAVEQGNRAARSVAAAFRAHLASAGPASDCD